MNVAEWLTSFSAWLTTRQEPIIFGACHDAGAPAEITGKFIAANKLPPVRKNWGKKNDGIKHAVIPPIDDVTNWPSPQAEATSNVANTPEIVTGKAMGMLATLEPHEQNKVMATLFQNLTQGRKNRLNSTSRQVIDARESEQKAERALRDLENVGLGLFSVFQP